jgi:tetratricopeptide (TPR) repeat protein
MKTTGLLGLCASFVITAASASSLLDSRTVLQRIDTSAQASSKQTSPAASLMRDVEQFRTQSDSLAPAAAAQQWLSLLERAQKLGPVAWTGDYSTYDKLTRRMVGVKSVLAALPPPAAWPELNKQIDALIAKDPRNVRLATLQFISRVLSGNATEMLESLDRVQHLTEENERQRYAYRLAPARTAVANIFGDREQVVKAFRDSVASDDRNSLGALQIPDLVGVVGEQQAEPLLLAAVTSSSEIMSIEGEATRALARRLALEHADQLAVAQWALVDSIDAVPLYEALERRFSNGSSSSGASEFQRRDASIYYLLGSIVQGEQEKAERALAILAKGGSLYVPREAINALQRAGENERLYAFLHAALEKHSDLQVWDVYLQQASFTGHSKDALALIQRLLKTKLSESQRHSLERYEAQALLANDRVDDAVTVMQKRIQQLPKSDSDAGETELALQLARIGVVLNRPKLTQAGLRYATAAYSLPAQATHQMQAADALQTLLAAYRRAGMNAAAQSLALEEFKKPRQIPENYSYLMIEPRRLAALTELVSLYVAAGQHQDALALLNECACWGANDLNVIMEGKDSLGTPLGMSVARALAATGDTQNAASVAKALIERMPGYDPAYELLTHLQQAKSLETLDAIYAKDQFEERPLIWKAQVLKDEGKLVEAEQTARQAIAIDPSDGEQGKNDRMRAYAVLADVLEAKGDTADADLYRKAVAAIRLSERADDFRDAGLHDRALAMYQDSLSLFSDAYCIQSRLAIQLTQRGRHTEAMAHYRKAYELMPTSFGRVESHCFGCESVFKDSKAQGVAEEVFVRAIERDPQNPQAHYLLGYLREEQQRFADALEQYRLAVALDPEYLNAWKKLNELGEHTYIEPAERDIARFKLLTLDPRGSHIQHSLSKVASLSSLWATIESMHQDYVTTEEAHIYPLAATAARQASELQKLPPEMQAQVTQYQSLAHAARDKPALEKHLAISQHQVIAFVAPLIGAEESEMDY